jgi:hypothetical protein
VRFILDTESPRICIKTLQKSVQAEIYNYKRGQGKDWKEIGDETNKIRSTLSVQQRKLTKLGYIK